MRSPRERRRHFGRGRSAMLPVLLLACGGVDDARPVHCDPLADTGCPSGEHCRLDAVGATLCLAPTPVPDEGGCGTGSCAPTEACVRVEGYLACRALCDRAAGDDAACPGDARCGYALTDRYGVCVPPCDPFPGDGPDPCPGGTCAPVPDLPFPTCVATGSARLGEACASRRCARRLACLEAGEGAHCRPLCEPGRDDQCPAPLECGGEVAIAGIGYCTSPAP